LIFYCSTWSGEGGQVRTRSTYVIIRGYSAARLIRPTRPWLRIYRHLLNVANIYRLSFRSSIICVFMSPWFDLRAFMFYYIILLWIESIQTNKLKYIGNRVFTVESCVNIKGIRFRPYFLLKYSTYYLMSRLPDILYYIVTRVYPVF
jgi:hypothetical protein